MHPDTRLKNLQRLKWMLGLLHAVFSATKFCSRSAHLLQTISWNIFHSTLQALKGRWITTKGHQQDLIAPCHIQQGNHPDSIWIALYDTYEIFFTPVEPAIWLDEVACMCCFFHSLAILDTFNPSPVEYELPPLDGEEYSNLTPLPKCNALVAFCFSSWRGPHDWASPLIQVMATSHLWHMVMVMAAPMPVVPSV